MMGKVVVDFFTNEFEVTSFLLFNAVVPGVVTGSWKAMLPLLKEEAHVGTFWFSFETRPAFLFFGGGHD